MHCNAEFYDVWEIRTWRPSQQRRVVLSRMDCNAEFYYVGKIPRTGIGGLSKQRRVVLRRRNTVVGGKCALPSALLVQIYITQSLESTLSFRQPRQSCLDSPPHSLVSLSLLSSPLSSSITRSLQAQNLPFQQIIATLILLPLDCLHDHGTGPYCHTCRFIFSLFFFNLSVCPITPMWWTKLATWHFSFYSTLHTEYHIISYHIVYL